MRARARAEPTTLVLGIDSNAAGMAAAASRAARGSRRGGLANACFLVAAVEGLPAVLAGTADLVTIQLPWAALLRGLVHGDEAFTGPIAALVKPGGELRLLLSVTEREAGNGLEILGAADLARLTRALEGQGLRGVECRPATAANVAA
ncbi:MAG: hypothetical protein ACHQ15_08360, partial [Candidatus Limnocylindrales bacterium]